MPVPDFTVPVALQPDPDDYRFDLEAALAAVVGLRATVSPDAFTAEVLGTERVGNGVLIGDGLVATVGYLVTEAEDVWLTLADGRTVPGHVLGYDHETGFGLVQPLARLRGAALPIGQAARARIGDQVIVAGAGGRTRSVAARIVARQEFAGYWEYVLDEAIFTAPAHPHWGGTALIGARGELLGIGSLQLEGARSGGRPEPLNMIVPIDLLPPILKDLATLGRAGGPARPWLGLYAADMENRIAVIGVASGGPAARAGIEPGDLVLTVGSEPVSDLADFFRTVWSLGHAGVAVPLRIGREGRVMEVTVTSGDRHQFLKKPKMH